MLKSMGTANKAGFWLSAESHGCVMIAPGGLAGRGCFKELEVGQSPQMSGKNAPDFSKERELYAHCFSWTA